MKQLTLNPSSFAIQDVVAFLELNDIKTSTVKTEGLGLVTLTLLSKHDLLAYRLKYGGSAI